MVNKFSGPKKSDCIPLTKCNISEMEEALLVDDVVQIMPYSFYRDFTRNEILYFMYLHGIYVLPTTELIDWLNDNIIGTAIEIGAGRGTIALALKIPATDLKQQDMNEVKYYMALYGAPTIKYPHFIEKLEALEAIEKYKPSTVIGAYITQKWKPGMDTGNQYGPDEEEILRRVDRYINIGNIDTHKGKTIYKQKYRSHYFDWLITRAVDQKKNRIFIWTNPNL